MDITINNFLIRRRTELQGLSHSSEKSKQQRNAEYNNLLKAVKTLENKVNNASKRNMQLKEQVKLVINLFLILQNNKYFKIYVKLYKI